MKYWAVNVSRASSKSFPISRKKFKEARQVKNVISELRSLEERLNILLENYAEFERELLDATLEDALSFRGDWNNFADSIHAVNRRVVNLLTTSKLYLDQLRHTLSDLFGVNHAVTESTEQKTSSEYDSRFGYRVMEALRNHVQHRGLPVHRIKHEGKWLEDRSVRQHRTIVSVDPDQLADDPKFKKSVLSEMQQFPDVLDLRKLVRDYISGIGSVHKYVRDQTADFRKKKDDEYKQLIEAYQADESSRTAVLFRSVDESGSVDSKFSLFEDIVERRRQLQKKNHSFGDLTKVVISSR